MTDSFFAYLDRQRVSLHQGWPGDDDYQHAPDWVGTLGDWWLSNETFNLAHLRVMVQSLEDGRPALIGGGAEARFSLRKCA